MERSSSRLDPTGELVNTLELWLWRGAVFAGMCFTLYFGLVKELESGVWYDEALTTFFISLNWVELFSLMAQYEANMGLHYILLKAWSTISMSELWLRLFSLLAHIAAGSILYFGAKRYLGIRASYLFIVLFLTHYLLIRYSVEIRGYALATLFMALLWTAWMRLVVEKDRNWWPVYAILGAIAVHTHLLASVALFLFGIALLFTARNSHDVLRWALCHFIIFLSFTPLIIFVLTKESGQLGWIDTPTVKTLVYALFNVSGAYGQASTFVRYSIAILVFCIAPLTIIFYAMNQKRLCSTPRTIDTSYYVAALSGFYLPLAFIIGVFALSQLEPAFSTRFFIPYIPLLMLVAASAMTGPSVGRWAVMSLPLFYIFSSLSYSERGNTGWRYAQSIIDNRCKTIDSVLFLAPAGQSAYRYYTEKSPEECQPLTLPYQLRRDNYLDDYELPSLDWTLLNHHYGTLVVLTHTDYEIEDVILTHAENLNRQWQCENLFINLSISIYECR